MSLTAFFSRKSKRLIPQIETGPIDMDPDLERQFPQKALFGNSCRTLALQKQGLQDDTSIWLEATEIDNGQWKISKVEHIPNTVVDTLPIGDPIRKISNYRKQPVSFAVMLKLLGEFEYASGPFNLNIQSGQNKNKLRPDHFETLAKKEQVIFDTQGRPHPIKNGVIVTEGYFTSKAQEEAKSTESSDKLGLYLQSATLIKPLQDSMPKDAYLLDLPKLSLYMSTLLTLMQNVHTGLQDRLSKTSELSYKFSKFDNFLQGSFSKSSDKDMYMVTVGEPLHRARALINSIDAQTNNPKLSLFFQEFQLYVGIKLLEDCLGSMKKNNTHASANTLEIIEGFIEETSARYIELGGNEQTLSYLKSYLFEKDHKALKKEISDILERYKQQLDISPETIKTKKLDLPQVQYQPPAVPSSS